MFTAFMGAKGHKNMSHLSCCDTKSYKQEGKNNSMFVKTFWHVKVDDLLDRRLMLKIRFLQQFICRNFNKCLTKWLILTIVEY